MRLEKARASWHNTDPLGEPGKALQAPAANATAAIRAAMGPPSRSRLLRFPARPRARLALSTMSADLSLFAPCLLGALAVMVVGGSWRLCVLPPTCCGLVALLGQ